MKQDNEYEVDFGRKRQKKRRKKKRERIALEETGDEKHAYTAATVGKRHPQLMNRRQRKKKGTKREKKNPFSHT